MANLTHTVGDAQEWQQAGVDRRQAALDADIARDTVGAMKREIDSSKAKSEPVAVLRKVCRALLRWDSGFKRPNQASRNALRQLCDAKGADTTTWYFESSLRNAAMQVLTNEAEADHPSFGDGANLKGWEPAASESEYAANSTVRGAFAQALRTEATAADVQRVLAAMKADHKDAKVPSGWDWGDDGDD